MKRIDLAARPWHLIGWRPNYWLMERAGETGALFGPDVGPIPASLPGSAYTALRAAGVIPDWNVGLNSRACEWVEHRDWEFYTDIAADEIPIGEQAVLHADGLDYAGAVLVDGAVVARFSGALVRHRIDLSAALNDGRPHRLRIVFTQPPEEQGQIGRTSATHVFKPRFNFSWDWCPRLVPVGVWDDLSLVIDNVPAEVVKVLVDVGLDGRSGSVLIDMQPMSDRPTQARAELSREGRSIAMGSITIAGGVPASLRLNADEVDLWWPNGHGAQPLYVLRVWAANGDDAELLIHEVNVGFRRIDWTQCADAPAGAAPLLCEVNGRPVFLQGVNWTPVRLDYHAWSIDDYRRRIDLYREMGCTVLRVWGGAYLEREAFFDLCDRAGILVWQEFPLSSSGYENDAPRGPHVIAELCEIARDYVRRRAHHACKLLWCGGNELQAGPDAPLTLAHPAIAAMAEVVETEDPQTRYLPTSPLGPTFAADAARFGQGRHHHVHGPWNMTGTFEQWQDYWERDDALFRSESGMPGAASAELIERYAGDLPAWPPTRDNPLWNHVSAWWVQPDAFRLTTDGLAPAEALRRHVQLSQRLQADALGVAARAVKGRFPRTGAFIVWMGHDCFPCPSNTSIIDFDGNPKPAYHALREAFRGDL
ncbi:MAG TPA: glycoside hydrolase family 2 TIM barrel-domain containing protein [Tepidisphaeraceae bacterium]|jgi:beta-mannosidase|nr:glycoside hydrolase family 2 TIM barrel-domain containing protein [Tepidisphaeraceae bacterium]